jgi:formate dehydrogenase iron-sulfur subunit
MTTVVYVPCDSVALSLDGDAITEAIMNMAAQRGLDLEVRRNSSRGMFWLEPLIEVETSEGRIGYGPVTLDDVDSLFDAGFPDVTSHALCVGLVEQIPFLKQQQRLIFPRAGITRPVSIQDYTEHGGFSGLEKALELSPQAIVETITQSGLRGRGGAAFPTGIKWKTVLETESDTKYVVCNADEGDSGTFSDRMVMEGDPFLLIEGMTIAALSVGAKQGYIYLRSEYPIAFKRLTQAIEVARESGYLGDKILNSDHHFDIEVRRAAGSYVCGEETAMLESLEGKRGMVRAKPPLPAVEGLFGKPTIINNVITLASVPMILQKGAEFYRDFGMGRSRGTLPVQLAGNIRHGGLVEMAFGVTLDELINGFGGGTESGAPIKAVQIGGPLGAYLPASSLNTEMDYEALVEAGGILGHGGIVVFDEKVDMVEQAHFAMAFCALESCGKCTPCRIGSVRGKEVLEKISEGDRVDTNIDLLRDLCQTMLDGSLCAMGGMTPYPVLSALDNFPEDFVIASPKSATG